MTLFIHELRRNRLSLCIWSAAISFVLGVCVLIYPEMSAQMSEMGDMFADMGGFSEAFGMDSVNIGEFIGYFALECGETLGLGGAIFAAIVGVGVLSKEEREHTADLLLTHPISRTKVVTEKLLAVMAQILIMNLVAAAVTTASILMIGETVDIKIIALIFIAYLLLQIEIASIAFGISAFVRRGGMGIGIGVAIFFYFLNIVSNLTEDMEFLKYITPFGYAEGTAIVADEALNIKYLAIGVAFAVVGIISAFVKYCRKDIR